MSLTRRNDGCPQCRNRRLRCDKTEPECLKCLKKGLRCSGQGFECRFSSHMSKLPAHRNTTTTTTTPGGPSSTPHSTPVRKPSAVSSPGRRRREACSSPTRPRQARSAVLQDGLACTALTTTTATPGPASPQLVLGDQFQDVEQLPVTPSECSRVSDATVTEDEASSVEGLELVLSPAIEPLGSQRRYLFHHFSEYIASKMVIYDWGGNGYRDIILPIACQDETVGRAVCAVSAFHLGTNAQHMLATAEATQHAVLTKLLRDTVDLNPSRVFSLSAWAAIVVLLVGDTITGSTNYIMLLEMLKHFVSSAATDSSMPTNAKLFLLQQTKMFELFSSAATNERNGLEILSGPIEPYLDFFATYPALVRDEPRYTNMQLIRSAIMASCRLCVKRMMNERSYTCPREELEALKDTISSLDPGVEGEHALVWTCFVAAAESVQPDHREYFSDRLASLYGCTRFGTILQALEILEVIWAKQGKQKWTEFITSERPILVM
ncbi:hypothetical protein NLU13_2740 [Sarocladium strictum]|uniref:Zn(2)-C6 fungal-type domain-containing protein n=1 Tax=Sarocladium strictum TaxID=5046 RepID=A0AA39L9R8_SARSR|nr:hypothetical protein NLU13_2740 [Sarocladium strictum]